MPDLTPGYRVGVERRLGVDTISGVVVGLNEGGDVGGGVALGLNDGSIQAGVESTRAAGWSVLPNWS